MLFRKTVACLLSVVLIAIMSEPALPQEVTASKSETAVSHIIETAKNGIERWRTSTGFTDFNIELRGKIELTDDDQDIKSISDDGYLEINKTVFGSKRTIVIESLGGGKMKKEYYEGRTRMNWDPNGKQWLSEILPEIVRSTTIGAEGRVNRYFKKGGTSAVLEEIGRLKGDYTKAHYGNLLLQKNIPSGEMARVITSLAEEINSDYYLSSLLKDNLGKMLATTDAADAFFRATQKVGSDYYRSVILKESMKAYAASPAQVKAILQSAATIKSDYYLSVVLTTLLEQPEVKEESLTELIVVSKNIPSDYYRSEVLNKAIRKPGISKSGIRNAIAAVAEVNSDYYKTTVFNNMAEHATIEPELQSQIIAVLDNSVGSDYYASVTMIKILKSQQLSEDSFRQLMVTAGKLGSTSYAAEVFEVAAKRELTNSQLMDVLKASENIDSDHYLSSVLLSLAPKVRAAGSLAKDAYRQAAKRIDSDYYYGRAVKAID